MPLLFIDGFDHYAAAEVPRKWDAWLYSGSISIQSSIPRRVGSKYLNLAAANAVPEVVKTLGTIPDEVFVGFAFHNMSPATGHRGFSLLRARSPQATVVVNDDGSVSVTRGAYDGTVLGTSVAGVVPIGTWVYLEFSIYIHGSAGTFTVRVNDRVVLSGSSQNTQATATAGADALQLLSCKGTNGDKLFDDLYIADDAFRGDSRVDVLMPDGAGNYAQWDSSPSGTDNYANVDDDGDMDDSTTYNETDQLNEIDTFTFDDLEPTAGVIHGVASSVATIKTDAGQRGVTPICRMSSTDYSGTEAGLYDSWHVLQTIWSNPPDAPSDAWTESDVNGAEFGYKMTT